MDGLVVKRASGEEPRSPDAFTRLILVLQSCGDRIFGYRLMFPARTGKNARPRKDGLRTTESLRCS